MYRGSNSAGIGRLPGVLDSGWRPWACWRPSIFSFAYWSMGFGPISEMSKISGAACGRYIGCRQPQNSSSTVMNSSTSLINGLPGGNRKHQKLSMWLNTEQS